MIYEGYVSIYDNRDGSRTLLVTSKNLDHGENEMFDTFDTFIRTYPGDYVTENGQQKWVESDGNLLEETLKRIKRDVVSDEQILDDTYTDTPPITERGDNQLKLIKAPHDTMSDVYEHIANRAFRPCRIKDVPAEQADNIDVHDSRYMNVPRREIEEDANPFTGWEHEDDPAL